tara:strand:+ start:51 stop:659 length:609 start_codon:yes stop_codon:yes gene_type:complete
MARTVFFSFHYQRDITRVQVVKNHYVTKGNYTAAGFFDGSLEEQAKRYGDSAVKRTIDEGLKGSSVTCVLVGNETFQRKWVHYEIFKSIELGRGILGIRIHQISDMRRSREFGGGVDSAGANPFECLGYSRTGTQLQPRVHYQSGWRDAPNLSAISEGSAVYLPRTGSPRLDGIFRVYDWVNDDGFNNFDTWVERAARQAGK